MNSRLYLSGILVLVAGCVYAEPAPRTKPVPNVVPDLLLPPETQWNHFSPDQIPDFKIPKRYDPVVGTNMPVKVLIWHNVGRNLFRTVTNGTDKEIFESERVAMMNKGISAINFYCMRPTEYVPSGGDPTDSTGLPFNSLTQVVVGNGTHDIGDKGDWNKWIQWWVDNVQGGPLGATRPGKPTAIFMACTDYEGIYTGGGDQDSANHLVTGTYAMLEKTAGYAGQMYLGPLSTLGYVHDAIYDGGEKTFAWFNPADNEAPAPYRGKKMEGNPRIPASLEVAFSYESLLPEGYQTKDQDGNNFFVVTHFGTEPNTEHWATRVGAHVECSYQYTKPAGQRLYPMLKTVLERYGAYQYSPERKDQSGGRWIKEFGRFGITLQGDNNTEFMSTIGSEYTTPFVAEAEMLLACFCGADGITFWGSAFGTDINPPRPRKGNPQRGQKYNDPGYGNLDLEPMNYVLKAFWRMSAKATLESGRKLSFYDICDGTEEYLNWDTQASYDGGKVFEKLRALDWQYEKKTAVRAVINRKKKAIFILAFQPYGVEQNKVVVKYTDNGASLKKTLTVPPGKVMIYAYDLTGVRVMDATPVTKRK